MDEVDVAEVNSSGISLTDEKPEVLANNSLNGNKKANEVDENAEKAVKTVAETTDEVGVTPIDKVTDKSPENPTDLVEDNAKSIDKDTDKPIAERIDETGEATTSRLESDIIRQIEYYFSDSNLARDKFLQSEIAKNDGNWVPLTVLLTFKRLASLSKDPKVIVAAFSKSDEGLVQVSDDKEKLRRHPDRPVPEQNEEHRKEIISRTAYAKGFPLDTNMSELIAFFEPFQKVVNIVMRKRYLKADQKWVFKGSCFVTFANREQSVSFVEKDKVVFKDIELERKLQADYITQKKEIRISKSNEKAEAKLPQIKLPLGALFHIDGLSTETTRETIRDVVTELGADVAFIDFTRGQTSGFVRLTTEGAAKPFIEKLTDGKFKVDGKDISVRLLEGDEEKEFLEEAVKNMRSRINFQRNNKGGNRNKRRGQTDKHDQSGGKRARK